MSEGEKSSTGTPTILVVILAMLGLVALPQGGGKSPDSPPKASASALATGITQEASDDEKNLGPLATIKADRNPIAAPTACKKDPNLQPPHQGECDDIMLSEPHLRFLTVLVPDPHDASMSHEFDLTISAVQRAIESAGFVAVRSSSMPGFPPTLKESTPDKLRPVHTGGTASGDQVDLMIQTDVLVQSHEKWPASIFCRPTGAAKAGVDKTRLLVLLVPESPTWGVDKTRLTEAVRITSRHKALHKMCVKHTEADFDDTAGLPIRIVGPNFSGSVKSLVETLKPWALKALDASDVPDFVVYNGRSTSPSLSAFATLPDHSLHFRSTIYSNKALETSIRRFINKLTPLEAPARFAMLVESNTGFGQQQKLASRSSRVAGTMEYYSFPINISQIREAYTSNGYSRGKEPVNLPSPERLSPLEMVGKRGERDLIPVVTPGPSSVGGEMTLSLILREFERRRYDWVGIVATNPYDRLFLAQKVRESCPDARLFSTLSTTLYAHHTAVPYLRGMLVASTYPLELASQEWTDSPGKNINQFTHVGFGNSYEEGIYNATVAHLADLKMDDEPDLLDYSKLDNESSETSRPSVWISVVGQRGIYPLSTVPYSEAILDAGQSDTPLANRLELGGFYTRNASAPRSRTSLTGLLDRTWIAVFLTVAFGTFVGTLWYLKRSIGVPSKNAVWWKRVNPGRREQLDHPSARRLAALALSACFGQILLLSTPIWALTHLGGNRVKIFGLVSLSLVATATTFGGFLVALFRLTPTDEAASKNLAERCYRGLVAVISVSQVTISLFYVLWVLFSSSHADLRLFCARATRMVNGVTPLIPMLLIGVAGAVVCLGDWRRIGLRVRLNAIRNTKATGEGPLAGVRNGFRQAGKSLDGPMFSWPLAGVWASLPFWVGLALIAIAFTRDLPNVIEPYWPFRLMFLFAFTVTLGLMVTRLVDMIGISRGTELLLRRMAELPMTHAFDRMPVQLASDNFWRAASNHSLAGDDSDPRIDRQFKAVVVGYVLVQDAIEANERLRKIDRSALDRFRLLKNWGGPSILPLPTKTWWRAVDSLTPLVAPFWASRAMIATTENGDDDEADWAGLGEKDKDLIRWLRTCEDLIAMVLTRQLTWLRAAIHSIISFLVVGLLISTLVLTSYPFEPHGPMVALLGALTVLTVGVIVVIAIQANRDEVLSRMNKTPTDRFTLDRQFLTVMLTSIVPLLGLLGALSYSLSDLFRSLFEPFFRGG